MPSYGSIPEPSPAWEPPLVGRQRDVSRLLHALDEADAGRGALVVLIGEAGTGKSRLVSELTAAATERHGCVLVGRCYETERILPFAPWVDALRSGRIADERDLLDALEPRWRDELGRLLPELSSRSALPAGPGAQSTGRSGGDPRFPFEAISELLKQLCHRQVVVLVIEDAHWADDMSVRLLAFLGRRLHQTRLLVVATIREEELADVGLLKQSLDELDEQGALRRLRWRHSRAPTPPRWCRRWRPWACPASSSPISPRTRGASATASRSWSSS